MCFATNENEHSKIFNVNDFIINSDLSKQHNRYYFSAITHTTIGYGDMSPATIPGSIVIIVMYTNATVEGIDIACS